MSSHYIYLCLCYDKDYRLLTLVNVVKIMELVQPSRLSAISMLRSGWVQIQGLLSLNFISVTEVRWRLSKFEGDFNYNLQMRPPFSWCILLRPLYPKKHFRATGRFSDRHKATNQACFWTERGNWSTQRKFTRAWGENANSTQLLLKPGPLPWEELTTKHSAVLKHTESSKVGQIVVLLGKTINLISPHSLKLFFC